MSAEPGLLAQLVFWGALLFGLAVGGAVGAGKGLEAGGATTGLITGVLGLAGAGYALAAYWRARGLPEAAETTVTREALMGGVVFGMFSTFALLSGLFFVARIVDTRHPAEPDTARPPIAQVLIVAGNIFFVAAFAWMVFGPGKPIESFGVSLAVIAVAAIGYATAGLLTPGGSWTAVMIPLIVGVIFAMFSGLIRLAG